MLLARFLFVLVLVQVNIFAEKFDLDTSNNYSEFLNFGGKKLHKLRKDELENTRFKSKVDVLGEIFKTNIDEVKLSDKLDIAFLIDASSSVGEANFRSELKFVKKLLSDVTVDFNHTRVAMVTFSSPSYIIKYVDEISNTTQEHNKCLLLNNDFNNIKYNGGATFTLGAFKVAKEIFNNSSRKDSKKVLFLITDGYSNGGDPTELAEELKNNRITIFTIGIENGNYKELYDISTPPGQFYSYLLDSFNEFESLARRALHVDLKSGDYIPLGFNQPCDRLCDDKNCCDANALCSCGTTSGHYSCVCKPGYYGSGLKQSCFPCPSGTYSDGPNLCLPCPNDLHITVTPAIGIESCKCKSGYKARDNYACKEIKCPKLVEPTHGYFVKKCHQFINSTCESSCEVGYLLKESAKRLCRPDGTWSGTEPLCEIKTCSIPDIPKHGEMNCSHPDLGIEYDSNEQKFPVDTICHFKCGSGKIMIGSRQRTCTPSTDWDGRNTICRPIKCSRLPPIKFAKYEPSTCNYRKQEYGKMCRIECLPGFKLIGFPEKKCGGSKGTWSSSFEDNLCVDVVQPKLKCPNDLLTNSLQGKKFGHIVWEKPNATDNTDLNLTIWTKPAIANITDFKFEIGKTTITYYAQDAYNNQGECSFHVIVKDEEPPVIENCEDPPPFLTTDPTGANITWDEPNIFDNSQQVKVNKSHTFGFFEIGTTTVTYTATDSSGNQNICKLNITVEDAYCESLPDPTFGHSECVNEDDGIQCVITCQEGYAIPIAQSGDEGDDDTNFLCQHSNPTWYNPEGLENPECSVTKVSEDIIQTGDIILPDSDICNNTNIRRELENDLKVYVNGEVCNNCTIDASIDCNLERKEEQSNKILKKRQVDFEAVPHKHKKKKKKVNVKFQVRGKYLNETTGEVNVTLQHGYNVGLRYGKVKYVCPQGFVPRKKRCVQCPRGSFHNVTTNKCQSCPFGTYNENLGQTECVTCPLHFSTRKMHSKKPEDCKEQCAPGTQARKKIFKYSKQQPNKTVERITLKPQCRSCPIGNYQPDFGQIRCLPCPHGYTTTGVGSKSFIQCIPTAQEICSRGSICGNGICVPSNIYEFRCDCFDNYIGTYCDKFINHCDSNPCFNGGTCTNSENGFVCTCSDKFTGRYCEEAVEECKKICLNNGVCIASDDNELTCLCPPGYTGNSCEEKISYCYANLCEHNSSCLEEINTFRCECSRGYLGRRCNILPCDYRPCGKNHICKNLLRENTTKNDFECACPDGYTGEYCEEIIDHCKNSPCKNGGSCTNNLLSYSCSCSKLYYGFHCENKRNTQYVLNFTKYDVNDYIKLKGFTQNLTQITACLWLQTADEFNYGTLLSYATRTMDNAFTITDYTGLVLYINNNYVVTDVLLNDGFWHHFCATWKSLNGTYEIFVDGKLTKYGQGLSQNSSIQGYGNMIIGQEQDIIGGRFSLAESFWGKMSYVDIWSKALSHEEILSHYHDCNESIFGDIYGWPEMQENMFGNIQIINSSFCGKCLDPRPLYHGYINVIDNVAYYSCYQGYMLSNPKFSEGRKCTKASRWEGLSEPYCKRVYCGYPGFIRNGYPLGNRYYYNDKILYRCYHGYNMTGDDLITCNETGKWYPEKPQCIGIQCFAFKQPSNSNLTIMSEHSYEDYIEDKTKFDPGTQIEIVCDEKANLTGENVITCLENGTWDLEPPQCVLTEESKSSKLNCDINKVPKAPENGYIDLDTLYEAGNDTTNFVEYKCRSGYKLYGVNVTTCIIDGYWTEPKISCDIITCEQPNIPKNMILNQDPNKSYQFGSMASFQCKEGYNMFGSKAIRCLGSGKWSRMQGKCIKKSCKKPNIKSSTTIQGKSYLYEDKVKISCSSGATYELLCNKLGIWEGEKDDSC